MECLRRDHSVIEWSEIKIPDDDGTVIIKVFLDSRNVILHNGHLKSGGMPALMQLAPEMHRGEEDFMWRDNDPPHRQSIVVSVVLRKNAAGR
jgi:hypothetical protein